MYVSILKEEYVKKFALGTSSNNFMSPLSPARSARKRSLSQSRLDSFFSPGSAATTPGLFSLSDTFIALPSTKKKQRRATSSSATKSKAKKPAKRRLSTKASAAARKKKGDRRSSSAKSPPTTAATTPTTSFKLHHSSNSKIPKSLSSPSALKSPQSKTEALKLLNKAKKFKQMDLKNSLIKKHGLSAAELAELKMRVDLERQRRAAQLEEEKLRRKELRARRLREQQERRRLERIRQKEWLKPREDLTCEDSKVSLGSLR